MKTSIQNQSCLVKLIIIKNIFNNTYNNSNNNNNNSRTSMGFSLPWENGHSHPPESGVAPLASASNPAATPVRVTTL